MARDGGGGGALGWTLLGFLAGVAATLGVQILMGGSDRPRPEVEAPPPAAPTLAASSVKPKPVKKAAIVASAAPPALAAAQSAAEVADDAAAAGMTSRTTPTSDAPANSN